MATTATLLTEAYDGVPSGMNLALPPQEIADTECRYLQDGLVDKPGLVRRRGPLDSASGIVKLPRPGSALMLVLDPQGTVKYSALTGDATHGYFTPYATNLGSTIDISWTHNFPTSPPTNPYPLVDIKPAIFSGLMVGTGLNYDYGNSNGLALWQGGNLANYSPASVSVTRGSTTLTGAATSFSTSLTPGMWVFANTDEGYTSTLVGMVRSIQSNTSLTLASPSPYAITAHAATFQSIRGFAPKVVTGEITCDTSTTAVTGGKTKFVSQSLGTGTWQLYRASDMAFIGKVASVQSEFALTLTSNAAIALASAAYIALRADSDWGLDINVANKVGWLTSAYSDRQWYANNGFKYETTSRIWFSDLSDPEAVDLSSFDGDWLDVTSSDTVNEPIRALCATQTGLLVIKENETFVIEGSSPSTFTQRKLVDDGCLSGMSVVSYGGGALWAGRDGLHFYDGVQVHNLTADKLGDYWRRSMRTVVPTQYRMWATVDRDHYMLFVESISPNVAVIKGTVSSTPTKFTITLNLISDAFSILTNMDLRGSVTRPATAGQSTWFLVNGRKSGDSSDYGYVADGEFVFNNEAVDTITCVNNTAGPDFYFESKKFDVGQPLRLKRFKQLALTYLVQGGSLMVDTVIGLNDIGLTLTSNFPPSVYTWDTLRAALGTWGAVSAVYPTWLAVITGVFVPKRVRFMRKTQFLSFRLWQSANTITRLQLGPYELGFKMQRPGRV